MAKKHLKWFSTLSGKSKSKPQCDTKMAITKIPSTDNDVNNWNSPYTVDSHMIGTATLEN